MKKKQILIAGNGTSNTSVDFRRVPKGIEVFRVTAFFLEDKYYLGKNVDYFLDYYLNLDYVYLTLHHLNKRNEYKINKNNIYVTVTETANEHFPTVIPATPILHKNKAIAEFRRFYEYYYGHYLSTGITAIGLAASLGFEEIYLTGFDFYTNKGQLYPYIPLTPNSCELENTKTTDGGGIYRTIKYKGESNADAAVRNHPTQMQIDFIEL
ncbi:MAG: hypothetical protein LBH29_00170, partial [Elusimicrobiota bacterium]|nr:hypothetical protein [Elusimicrobiota bacterium]